MGVVGVVIIALVSLAGWGIYKSINSGAEKDAAADFSRGMPFEGAEHVSEGTDVSHESNPPTSGSHWPDPLREGIYDEEKPDEALIHGLEHGDVWVSYKPSIAQSAIDRLKEILEGKPKVILTPREANDTDIALAAWQRLDTFNLNEDGTFDEERILTFIRRYRDKGPESVPGTQGKEY